jgi:hypothetical protein
MQVSISAGRTAHRQQAQPRKRPRRKLLAERRILIRLLAIALMVLNVGPLVGPVTNASAVTCGSLGYGWLNIACTTIPTGGTHYEISGTSSLKASKIRMQMDLAASPQQYFVWYTVGCWTCSNTGHANQSTTGSLVITSFASVRGVTLWCWNNKAYLTGRCDWYTNSL